MTQSTKRLFIVRFEDWTDIEASSKEEAEQLFRRQYPDADILQVTQ